MDKARFLSLLYHDVLTGDRDVDRLECENRSCVLTRERFERHMRVLRDHGFRSVGTEDIVRHVNGIANLPPKAVAITFDDGHASNATQAAPILEEFGFRGIFFVTTGWIGSRNMLSWEQLREMKSRGMEVGSHTVSHPIPVSLDDEELAREVVLSKKTLENGLDGPVLSLSSPTGFHDRRMRGMARAAGYRALFVGVTRLFDRFSPPNDIHWIDRIDVKSGLNDDAFERLVRADALTTFAVRGKEYALGGIRVVMGPSRYNRLRRFLLSRDDERAEGTR